jgi:hypothetical protein
MAGNDYAKNFYGYRLVGLKSMLLKKEAEGLRTHLNHSGSVADMDNAIEQFGKWCDRRNTKYKCSRLCQQESADHSRCPNLIDAAIKTMKVAVRVFMEDMENFMDVSEDKQ